MSCARHDESQAIIRLYSALVVNAHPRPIYVFSSEGLGTRTRIQHDTTRHDAMRCDAMRRSSLRSQTTPPSKMQQQQRQSAPLAHAMTKGKNFGRDKDRENGTVCGEPNSLMQNAWAGKDVRKSKRSVRCKDAKRRSLDEWCDDAWCESWVYLCTMIQSICIR